MSLLSIKALDIRHGLLRAVRDVSFQVDQGETVALIGANGAGKTTLLRAIAGAHRATHGQIHLDGLDITRMPTYERVAAGIALVPEGRRLFAAMTVEENLEIACASGNGPSIASWKRFRCSRRDARRFAVRFQAASSRRLRSDAR